MRLLFVNLFPPTEGPVGRWQGPLIACMRAAGHEVRNLCARPPGAAAPTEGATVDFGPEPGAALRLPLPRFGADQGARGFSQLTEDELTEYRQAFRQKLDDEIARFDPHLVHAHYVWLGGQLVLETGVPYVLSAWGPELAELAAAPRYRPLAEQAADNAGRIIATTRQLGRLTALAFPESADRVCVLPPPALALDLSSHAAAGGAVRGASKVRRIVCRIPQPGGDAETLLNAAARWAHAMDDVTTHVLCDGPPPDAWQEQARVLQLERLEFLSAQDLGDARSLLAGADIYVLAAAAPHDGVELVAAQSCGTPVILTQAAACEELAPAEAFVADADHELLADRVITAISEDWQRHHGAELHELTQLQFAAPRLATEIVRLYEAVLDARHGQRWRQ